MLQRFVFILFLTLPQITAAQDLDFVRPADLFRLNNLDTALGVSLRGALAEGPSEDASAATTALRGNAITRDPTGNWNCRVIKMGNLLPVIAYSNFRCRISSEGPNAWRLTKLTGSQRSDGIIRRAGDRLIYTGVGYVDGGPALAYQDLPLDIQTPVEPGQTHAMVGVFEQMSSNRARLLLPWPLLESSFDILYLTR